MSTNPFNDSSEALNYFLGQLKQRGISITEVRDIRVSAGRGKFVTQQQIWTDSKEIYHVKYWTQKWYPKDSSRVSEFAKPLDDRLKYAISRFGNGDTSASGLNESTLFDLLALGDQGYQTFLLTMFQNGEIYLCRAEELYNFATKYGLTPQYSNTYGEPFIWIPTGWFKTFHQLVTAPPEVK